MRRAVPLAGTGACASCRTGGESALGVLQHALLVLPDEDLAPGLGEQDAVQVLVTAAVLGAKLAAADGS
jgi:hypothetical protein